MTTPDSPPSPARRPPSPLLPPPLPPHLRHQNQQHHHLQQQQEEDQRQEQSQNLLDHRQDQAHQHPQQDHQRQPVRKQQQQRRRPPPALPPPPPPPLPPAPARLPLLPPPRRTNPIVWCIAVFCLILAVVIVISAVFTLVLFLAIRPRLPSIDIPSATLDSLYLDSPNLLNGDLTLVLNISNANHRIDIRFELLVVELYLGGTMVATQMIEPFRAYKEGWRAGSLHFLTSQVGLGSAEVALVGQMVQTERISTDVSHSEKVGKEVLSAPDV
ncbi:uncharacterized protein LOC116250342 [Nymphaea colorata]|uniref:uncharacterized protein LOC116250342 n=1 Tax=Nymphaea colorata TaxID=210225 RepID=UPI00129DD9BA|nr:uncharacterized protein LOC116250342 [Nymphaea colorata]